MTFKIECRYVYNFGDFLNCLPVISGIYKSVGDTIKFVIPDQLRIVKGIREFLEFQPMFESVYFRSEIINMDEKSYLVTCYSQEEFRNYSERPNRPIETQRHEKFIRDHYPDLNFKVDDSFYLQLDVNINLENIEGYDPNTIIIGDRWSKVTDTRRDCNIFQKHESYQNLDKFYYLNYDNDLMLNANILQRSNNINYVTFTGSGMLADLIYGTNNVVFWDDSMVNWNNAPIEYSYWKHFYADRNNKLVHINEIVGK
jgi:hypothetical protein